MKALTVQQPWAWAIIHGGKDVENRTQAWTYRGPLAIHAGQAYARHVAPDFLPLQEAFAAAHQRLNLPELRPLPGSDHGYIIGVVDLVDVHLPDQSVPCCTSPWAEMQAGVHLVLEHPRPLARPISARGRLGLWDLTPEQEYQLVLECAIEGKV